MNSKLAEILYIKALSERLGTDQGVIIHHEDRGYIVYKNIANKTMGIQEDEQFLRYEHGTLVNTSVSKQDPTTTIEETEAEEEVDNNNVSIFHLLEKKILIEFILNNYLDFLSKLAELTSL